MGASFRNIGEIIELAGCDLLTISPALLGELNSTQGDLSRHLDPDKAATLDIQSLSIDKATFDQMHAQDRMASDKLDEGIKGFTKALETLEQLLAVRLARIESNDHLTHATEEIFHVYDMNGDGYITRDEWMGTDAVFDALDRDRDGKISPEEMGAGLGAVLQLAKAS